MTGSTAIGMSIITATLPSVSDEVYDRLFDELKELEQETGIQMANSPTQTVGYPAVSRLEKNQT